MPLSKSGVQGKALLGRLRRHAVTIDQAVIALNNVSIIFIAARTLTPTSFSALTLGQLAIVSVVIVQRASTTGPALATQRTQGRSAIPLSWMVVPVVLGAVGAVLLSWYLALNWRQLSFLTIAAILVAGQDLARFMALSRGLRKRTLVADAAWAAATATTCCVYGYLLPNGTGRVADFETFLLLWGLSAALPCVVLLWTVQRQDRVFTLKRTEVRATFRLGRWGAFDAALSVAANFVPLLVAYSVFDPELAGAYRAIQSVQGPLNIVASSLVISAGLSAWTLSSRSTLRALPAKTRRTAIRLCAFAMAYMAVGGGVVLLLTGIEFHQYPQVLPVVVTAAAMGALTAPYAAGAAALGQQRSGALIRIITLLTVTIISFSHTVGIDVKDPVASSVLSAALLSMGGWFLAQRRGVNLAFKEATDA